MHSIGNGRETAENEAETVRTCQIKRKTRNSPSVIEIAMAKLPSRWKKVSIGGGDMYVPWNTPIGVLGTANQRIVFGRAESRVEAIAPSVEGERAGEGNSNGSGGDRDGDGTISGGSINST